MHRFTLLAGGLALSACFVDSIPDDSPGSTGAQEDSGTRGAGSTDTTADSDTTDTTDITGTSGPSGTTDTTAEAGESTSLPADGSSETSDEPCPDGCVQTELCLDDACVENPYSPCSVDADCPIEGSSCLNLSGDTRDIDDTCSPPGDGGCPPLGDFDTFDAGGLCFLECDDSSDCPGDYECKANNNPPFCFYPLGG